MVWIIYIYIYLFSVSIASFEQVNTRWVSIIQDPVWKNSTEFCNNSYQLKIFEGVLSPFLDSKKQQKYEQKHAENLNTK